MTDAGGIPAHGQAFDAVGMALWRMLREGDDRIECRVSMTATVSFTKIMAYNPDGRYETPDGRANAPRETDELHDAVRVLREVLYRADAGTWFGVRFLVTAGGAATADYTYDEEPDWGLGGIDSIAYVTDQEKFPRNEAHQPEWLKKRLAEGRARLAARGADQPTDPTS